MIIMMRTRVLRWVCALLGLLLLSAPLAYGGKVYKWIIDGKTVYMDKKPPSDKGKVEEKRIDDERNVIHMTPVDTEVSGGSRNTGPRRNTPASKNNKSAAAKNQTDKNAVGSTGTASTGRTPDARTGSNTQVGPNARTGSSFVRGRGGITAGPGATPGPGI
jgi:hypothetical protein